MVKEILEDIEDRMKKTVELYKRDLATMRAGRATPALLDRIQVDYYGVPTPVNQMASIATPEPRLLVIQPWDKSTIPEVEKAIMKSDLGLTPDSDGNVIRLVVPQLTQERRQELVKSIKRQAEEERVAIRNLRREANDDIKQLEKESEISEDESRRHLDKVQELTNEYIASIDEILATKEQDIMEVGK